MQHFKNVLFVLDDSKGEKAALDHIAQLVLENKGKLKLLLPSSIGQIVYATPETTQSLLEIEKGILKARKAELAGKVKALKTLYPDLSVTGKVREGIDYREVILEAVSGKYHLVAKASNNNGMLSGLLFGTLDLNLLRKCPVPVLIIKGKRKIRFKRVVAAVDLVRYEDSRVNLDKKILDLAAAVVSREQGQLAILHAWFLRNEKILRNAETTRFYKSVKTMLSELKGIEKEHLALLAEHYADLNPDTHLIKGKPQEVIPGFTKSHRSHLVVMGTLGRTGIAGLFIGNTAEKILQKLNCSVLAVKPEGFICPVIS